MLILLLIDQQSNASLEGLKTLSRPGFQQVSAALVTLLALKHRRRATQLFHRTCQRQSLKLPRFQERRETSDQIAVLQEQLVGEQTREIQIRQLIAAILSAADRFKARRTEIALLQVGNARPEQAVMLQCEVLELAASQFLADSCAMWGAVKVKAQNLCFATFTLTGLASLLVAS